MYAHCIGSSEVVQSVWNDILMHHHTWYGATNLKLLSENLLGSLIAGPRSAKMIFRLQEVTTWATSFKDWLITLIGLVPLGFDLHPPTCSQNRRHYTRMVQKLHSETCQSLIQLAMRWGENGVCWLTQKLRLRTFICFSDQAIDTWRLFLRWQNLSG